MQQSDLNQKLTMSILEYFIFELIIIVRCHLRKVSFNTCLLVLFDFELNSLLPVQAVLDMQTLLEALEAFYINNYVSARVYRHVRLCLKWLPVFQAAFTRPVLAREDQVRTRNRSEQKDKCRRRLFISGSESTRWNISLWLGCMPKLMTKTNCVCQRFGVLFVESMKAKYVGTRISLRHDRWFQPS